MPVLVLAEQVDGGIDDVSRQAVTLARGYAEAAGLPLEAILIGADGGAAGWASSGCRRRTLPPTRGSRRTPRRRGAGSSPS